MASSPRPGPSRRHVLQLAAVSAALGSCGGGSLDPLFRRHYQQLDAAAKQRLCERLEQETLSRTGVQVHIGDPPPIAGTRFAFALDRDACNGCRRCVEACARENNLPSDPELRYIRVLSHERGANPLREPDARYEGTVPAADRRYLPVQCQQCARPPCVEVCPCEATWQQADGIVVVDYDWCIGCRYCEAACPYHARRFNFARPSVAPDRIQTEQAYLSNRLRPTGVIEKCTFCLQRVRRGLYPACLEACPTGARKFGDLNDPTSEVRRVLERKNVWVLKQELGTVPRFFYFSS